MTITIRNPETGETLEVAQDQFEQVYQGQGYEALDEEGNVVGAKNLEDMTRAQLDARYSELDPETSPSSFSRKADIIAAIQDKEAAANAATTEPAPTPEPGT